MKKSILVVVGLVVAPLVLSLIGSGLAWLFSCTGVDVISRCSVPAMTGLISGLVSMTWLLVIAIPVGAIAIVIIFVFS